MFLLGGVFAFQYSQGAIEPNQETLVYALSPIYGCVIFVFLLSIIYAVVYRRLVREGEVSARRFAIIQIMGDVLIVSYLLVVSGGTRSVLAFLYLLIVIYAGILLAGRGGFLAASLCSLAYPLALLSIRRFPGPLLERLEVFGAYQPQQEEIIYASLVNVSSLFLTAALVSIFTERLRVAREQLARREIDYRSLEELHRQILANLTSGILTINRQGEITYLNRAAEQMLGRKLPDVYRLPLTEAFPEIASAAIRAVSIDPWSRPEVRIRGSDGTELDLGFSVNPFDDAREGGKSSIIIFQDLTNLKRAEERLKRVDRLAAIGTMAAGIAHEIRNPLASISGSIQLLRGSQGVSEEDGRLMAVIQREIGRLDSLISNFLSYSSPMQLRLQPCDLKEIVREVVEALGTRTTPPLRIDVVYEGEDFRLRADPDKLKQVLWNLLLNARQVLEKTGGRIEIALFRHGPEGPLATCGFRVSDTGPGIPPGVRPKMFTPFFTTRPDGTGLGLALVDRIVGLHGGTVDAGNLPGGGACFEVTLPVKPPQPLDDAQPPAAGRP
ncbi:MAG: ATP-binding protein [Bdellovibrionota bacterium]